MYFWAICGLRLFSPSYNGIWPSALLRVIYNSSFDCPVRKLPYCPQSDVLFVNYIILIHTYLKNTLQLNTAIKKVNKTKQLT